MIKITDIAHKNFEKLHQKTHFGKQNLKAYSLPHLRLVY